MCYKQNDGACSDALPLQALIPPASPDLFTKCIESWRLPRECSRRLQMVSQTDPVLWSYNACLMVGAQTLPSLNWKKGGGGGVMFFSCKLQEASWRAQYASLFVLQVMGPMLDNKAMMPWRTSITKQQQAAPPAAEGKLCTFCLHLAVHDDVVLDQMCCVVCTNSALPFHLSLSDPFMSRPP